MSADPVTPEAPALTAIQLSMMLPCYCRFRLRNGYSNGTVLVWSPVCAYCGGRCD